MWMYDGRWRLRDRNGHERCVRCRSGVFRDRFREISGPWLPNPQHRFGYHRQLEGAIAGP
jgi:hypothetical protein